MDNVEQYGYEDSLFISETQEHHHCGACMLVLRDPVVILCCGHKLCLLCFERIKTYSEEKNTKLCCPVDKKAVDLSDIREDVAMRRMMGNMVVRCPEHEKGCVWTGDLSNLDAHIELRHFSSKPVGNGDVVFSCQEAKKVNDCLDLYECTLVEKDKEVASLKHEQQRLQDEVNNLKQQQQHEQQQLKDELKNMKEQQQQQLQHLEQQQQQLQHLEQQQKQHLQQQEQQRRQLQQQLQQHVQQLQQQQQEYHLQQQLQLQHQQQEQQQQLLLQQQQQQQQQKQQHLQQQQQQLEQLQQLQMEMNTL